MTVFSLGFSVPAPYARMWQGVRERLKHYSTHSSEEYPLTVEIALFDLPANIDPMLLQDAILEVWNGKRTPLIGTLYGVPESKSRTETTLVLPVEGGELCQISVHMQMAIDRLGGHRCRQKGAYVVLVHDAKSHCMTDALELAGSITSIKGTVELGPPVLAEKLLDGSWSNILLGEAA